jgi:uncharacterized sulfatase
MKDSSPYVRIAAAEALGQFGPGAQLPAVLDVLTGLADWSRHDTFIVMTALHALDALGSKIAPAKAAILALPKEGPAPDGRYAAYVPRLLEKLRDDLGGGAAPEPAPAKAKRKKAKG